MRLAGHFLAYSLVNGLGAAVPFLLLPVLTRYFSPGDFGVLAVFQAFLIFVSPMVVLATNTAVVTAFFRLGSTEVGPYVTSCLAVPAASVVALSCAFAAGKHQLESHLGIPAEFVALIPLFALMQVIPGIVLSLFQIGDRPWAYGMFQIFQAVSNLLLSILFVVILHRGVGGRLLGIFLSSATCTGIGLVVLRRKGYLPMKVRMKHLRDAASFGAPLIPHSVGGTLLGLSDRFILARTAGMATVGVYAAAVQVMSVILLCMTAMNLAWVPFLFASLKNSTPKTPAMLVKYTYVLFGCIGGVFILVQAAAPVLIKHLLSPRYQGASRYVFWLGIAYCCNGLYFLVGNYFFYANRTGVLGGITLTCATVNIGLNLLLVPRLGAIGSAYAAAASWSVFFLITWAIAAHLFPMPWRRVLWRGVTAGARQVRRIWQVA